MAVVAQLYAEAALSLDQESFSDLLEFQKACRKEDITFFNSSLISFAEKKKVLDKVGLSKKALGFLYQLTLKKRWNHFKSIIDKCLVLLDQKQGVLKGEIYSVQDISDKELTQIKQSLTQIFKNKKIQLQKKQRKDLLGGIRVEIGGFCFDNSVSHHLNQFKEQVKSYGC